MLNIAIPTKRDSKYLRMSIESILASIRGDDFIITALCPRTQLEEKKKLLEEYNKDWIISADDDCRIKSKISWTSMINKMWKMKPTKFGSYWSDDILINKRFFPLQMSTLYKNKDAGATAAAWTRDTSLKKFHIYGSDTKIVTINYGIVNLENLKAAGWFKIESKFYDGDYQISKVLQENGKKVIQMPDCKVVDFNGNEKHMEKMVKTVRRL